MLQLKGNKIFNYSDNWTNCFHPTKKPSPPTRYSNTFEL